MAITTYRQSAAPGWASTSVIYQLEAAFTQLGWHGGTVSGIVTGLASYSGQTQVGSSSTTFFDARPKSGGTSIGAGDTCSFVVDRNGGSVNQVYVNRGGHGYSDNDNLVLDGADIGGTGCVGITKGTTGQRPSSPAAGDFRYNTTDGKFEGYTDEWGEIGGGGGAAETDVAVSSTSATAVYTIAHATYRSAYMIMQITQGSAYQVGRYLVIHDGTTATIVEESAIATGSMLGTFTAGIDGSNLKVYVNMGSASSATVTVLPNPVTV